jgi:crotonobetainyl-CoA:carnitine CoA-transferase CaiB-like acyl-CoA transferase
VSINENDSLTLRCVMSLKTRQQYAGIADGSAATAAANREDSWQRSVEFLFERLVTGWTVAGVEWEGQKELLQRWRVASQEERSQVREALRKHLAEWFPEMSAP